MQHVSRFIAAVGIAKEGDVFGDSFLPSLIVMVAVWGAAANDPRFHAPTRDYRPLMPTHDATTSCTQQLVGCAALLDGLVARCVKSTSPSHKRWHLSKVLSLRNYTDTTGILDLRRFRAYMEYRISTHW